jgi:hypothetical protein
VRIDGVDVLGGTQEALSLATNVTIVNPSNLNLGMGDLGMYFVHSVQTAAKNDYSIQSSSCLRMDRRWERH